MVINSNRGLCGPFNTNAIKAARAYIEENYREINQKGQLDLFTIGKKATDFFRKNKFNVVNSNNDIFDALTFANTAPIAGELMSAFAAKKYDKIEIIYNHFKNAGQQVLTIDQYLPVIPVAVAPGTKTGNLLANYIFEPDESVLVKELIPKMLKVQLYKTILDSYAAEHGARMTAMAQATENAQDLLKQLRLSYNKARQGAITTELLEIVSGAEALRG
jgi:F-type H+-transporting ATPase subunit gamma